MDPRDSDAGGQGTQPYRFDEIVVDPAAHAVLRAGAVQPLEPKAFAVLLALLRHPGELVGRDELLDQVAACSTRGHGIRIKVGTGFVERNGDTLAFRPSSVG